MVNEYFPEENKYAEPEPILPLGKRIAAFYGRQWQSIKRMKRFVWISAAIYLLALGAAAAYFFWLFKSPSRSIPSVYNDLFRESGFEEGAWGTFFRILMNNLNVGFKICLVGLIPFFIPTVFFVVINAGAMSLLLVMMAKLNLPVLKLFSTMIMPHGIIELPTFVFTAGFSLYISSQMTKRIFKKKAEPTTRSGDLFGTVDQSDLPDRLTAFGDILQLFAAVILPLTVIAAFLEAFVTPFIYRLIF